MGPPPVEALVVVLVAPPPPPVEALVELTELLAVVELAELLAVVELAELLAVVLAELLAVVELTELLAVVLVTSAPPSPPAPPAPPKPPSPPVPDELLAVPPPVPDEPLAAVVELLVVDTAELVLLELEEVTPTALVLATLPPPVFSSRLWPSAHAAISRREAAESAVAPPGQELDRRARSPRPPDGSGAPGRVDALVREPGRLAAPDVVRTSRDAHLGIGRILNTPASARPSPKVERKESRPAVYTASPDISKRFDVVTFCWCQKMWPVCRGL
ncbi:hypothetical protein [Sorangium sp. So ce1335]|uniref:hypothetical protein n=1 Tax=Sorangium sp. So ce1335 TaxID=3133335 RepID=UPI003F5F736D